MGVAIEGNDIWYMGRDGKGFFILHGTIDQDLVSLLLHSPPQMIFLGHILYRISPISILGRNALASLYMGLIYYVWLNFLFGNNFWNHDNFVHTKSITEYKLFGNKITDYHHPRLYHYRSYYYRSVVLLFSNNTESSITNINYYVLFVSRTVLLPIRYITNKSYYRIDYHRFVLLLNIPIPE